MGDVALARTLAERGIRDVRVLEAIARLDRHRFVPTEQAELALNDTPLPIGHAQTISQPYVVAVMTEALRLDGTERVLEVGTGSGYQTAVLAQLCREVFSIEIVPPLHELAKARLHDELGMHNVHLRLGDGHRGWPEAAPFDAILLTAAPAHVPEPLLGQLSPTGRLVAPVGDPKDTQTLIRVAAKDGVWEVERLLSVRFVPMTHRELVH